jgi:hypothetical protein
VQLREKLVDGGDVTIHRLLWEYGRATLAPTTSAFGEQEWASWLGQVAKARMDGMQNFNLASIGSMVNRPDLDEGEVFRRLSEILDSEFASRQSSQGYQLSPDLVAHALAVALLAHLNKGSFINGDGVQRTLDDWLDPIAGLDEKAEILRAAISVLLAEPSTAGACYRLWSRRLHSHICLNTIVQRFFLLRNRFATRCLI